MKKAIVLICFCLMSMSASAWHDTKYDTLEVRWPNGNIKEYVTRASHLGNEKGFLPHGIYRTSHENGQLQEEGHYDYNVKVGVWNYWNVKGNPIKSMNFDNGRLTGRYILWHHDHTFKVIGHYADRQKNGLWVYRRSQAVDEFNNPDDLIDSVHYYQDGKLLVALEGSYGQELHEGKSFHNEESDLWIEWKKHNGMHVLTNYKSFSIGRKVDGLKEGKWSTRNASGALVFMNFYEKGELKF